MKQIRVTISMPPATKEQLNQLVSLATSASGLSNRSKVVVSLIHREAKRKLEGKA